MNYKKLDEQNLELVVKNYIDYYNQHEEIINAHGANHLELLSVNDEHHMHFYGKFGFYLGNNLTLMAKHYE